MQDFRLEIFEAAPPYTASVPPPASSNFVNTKDVLYLKDREACRSVGKCCTGSVRFDIYENEFELVERWIKQRNGEWHNIAIEVPKNDSSD